MPVTIHTHAGEGVRYAVFSGVVSNGDVLEAYQQLSEAADSSMDLVADAMAIERLDVTANEVRMLAHRRTLDGRRNGTELQRIAVVAPTDGAFGVARMYQSYRETFGSATQYLVCRRMSEARQGLGLQPIATDD